MCSSDLNAPRIPPVPRASAEFWKAIRNERGFSAPSKYGEAFIAAVISGWIGEKLTPANFVNGATQGRLSRFIRVLVLSARFMALASTSEMGSPALTA